MHILYEVRIFAEISNPCFIDNNFPYGFGYLVSRPFSLEAARVMHDQKLCKISDAFMSLSKIPAAMGELRSPLHIQQPFATNIPKTNEEGAPASWFRAYPFAITKTKH
jgi:hypothetical protein